jgi:hypothetical protein
MTSDVADGASVIARLGGGAAQSKPRGGEESGRPIIQVGCPTIGSRSRRSSHSAAYAFDAISASSVSWLALASWLARSLRRYAARNGSIENTVLRDSL